MKGGTVLLWYRDKNHMVKVNEGFDSLEEAVGVAEQLSYEFFQITEPSKHNRVLNGTRIQGEVLWRLEGSHRPLIRSKW
jgi:hypothetical protein